jgi:transcription elongation factor Elf1
MKNNCLDCSQSCTGLRCKKCANRITARTNSLRYNVDVSNLIVDCVNFTAIDTSGNRIPVKMKFSFKCVKCKHDYQASLIFERDKKYPWNCKSCAISCEWSDPEYRKVHVDELTKANSTPEARLRRSLLSKSNWKNDNIRQQMLTNRDRKLAAAKGKATRYANLLSGKSTYRVSHGKRVLVNGTYMRSTYEARFAVLLDSMGIEWKYEPKHFSVLKEKTYLPDFYIPNVDAYFEIKGWWRDDAKEKFDAFVNDYPHVKYAIVNKDVLESLERKEISLETCIIKERR